MIFSWKYRKKKLFLETYHPPTPMISLYKLNTQGAGPISFHKFWNFGKTFFWHIYSICTFSLKHPIVKAFLVTKPPKLCKIDFVPKNGKLRQKIQMWAWKSLNDWSVQNKSLRKHCIRKWHIAVKKPIYMLSNYFDKKKYLEVLLGQSGAYMPICNLKTLLSQSMVHFTWRN